MKKEKRFEILEKQSFGTMREITIYVDKLTGVQYLFVYSGYGGGLTPLLGKDGKPIIEECG